MKKARILFPVFLVLVLGCSSGGGGSHPQTAPSPRAGSTPVALEFVRAYENVASEPYFPLDGVSGCVYTSGGSLIICDEKRGKVFGHDAGNGRWYEFDTPMVRPYRPVDVQVDGFKVLVLDAGSNTVQRFDLSGAYQDQVLDIRRLDPGTMTQPGAFALDRDGRMAITDVSQQQVLLLDAFLALNSRLGEPGIQDDQFAEPQGITFLPDGRVVVADTGNSRLSRYGRMGFFEDNLGGRFDSQNPFLAPVGVDSDRYGNLFVADLVGGKIHVVGRNFRPLDIHGEFLPGEGRPENPVDLAVGPDGQLAVTDRSRQAVLIYRIVYE